jgi:hypothetical protein
MSEKRQDGIFKSRMVIKGDSFLIEEDEEIPPRQDRTVPKIPTSQPTNQNPNINRDHTQPKLKPYIPQVSRLGRSQRNPKIPIKSPNQILPILTQGGDSLSNLPPNSNRSANSNSQRKKKSANSVVFAEGPPSTSEERRDSCEKFVKPDVSTQKTLAVCPESEAAYFDRVPKGGWVKHPCLVACAT